MRAIVLIIFCISVINIYSQNKIVTGRIYNQEGEILNGVSVCQESTFNCYFSDYMGVFHVLMDPSKSNIIVVQEDGYKKLRIEVLDTMYTPLNIVLEREDLRDDKIHNPAIEVKENTKRKVDVDVFISFKIVSTPMNFDEFLPQLQEYNINLLNKNNAVLAAELGFNFNRIYAGFEFGGVGNIVNEEHDTLDVELNKTKWSFSLGYNLLDSKRFTITPNVALKINRNRLINHARTRQIQLDEYIDRRDLDIRMNQLTGYAGIDLCYNMFPKRALFCDYYSIGISGGYITKLNKEPYIYSVRDRLRTSNQIGIKNYEFGFFFRLNY